MPQEGAIANQTLFHKGKQVVRWGLLENPRSLRYTEIEQIKKQHTDWKKVKTSSSVMLPRKLYDAM